ncbi:MAG: fructose-bisphosphate aldolase class I [Candidatus Taylorbacteria bacterium]|nr:fructose-bisphosphate aldolase class I [Candidatus Taylorbacteria bacterium]
MSSLQAIAKELLAPHKGILAADESDSTCVKRFDKYGIEKTPEQRRKWRELLFSAPNISDGLSGIILYDETIRQNASTGEPFAQFLLQQRILPGIKVDQKTEPFTGSPDEEVTKGLDGLPKRLAEYAKLGATFTKWRAVIRISDTLPTEECLRENAKRLAIYAKQSQEAGLVPIIEPEVLLDGEHTLERSEAVLTQTLRITFEETVKAGVELSGLILKSSMALPGKESGKVATLGDIASATLRAFFASVPKEVPGIVFLSGGQTPEDATARLNEIVKQARKQNAPWRITFSYSRALQEPVLKAWSGKDENVETAQKIFERRVQETSLASEGAFE